MVAHNFNQKRCEMKVVEYVIIDKVPFRAVEGKGFVALLHELEPRFRIPDRKKVAGMVHDLLLEHKKEIKNVIRGQDASMNQDDSQVLSTTSSNNLN